MKKVPFKGPDWAKLMIVGEAPGADEEREGEPFVGKAGKLLRKFLLSNGIDPDEVYFANLSLTRPPGNKLVNFFDWETGAPKRPVLEGMGELQDAIQRIRPNLILAVGNYPLWALTGLTKWDKRKRKVGEPEPRGYGGIFNWRGSVVPGFGIGEGFKVLPTFHPAFILREGMDYHGLFDLDLGKAKREMEFPEIRPRNIQKYIDPRGAERDEVTQRIFDSPDLIIDADIEYLGNKLICVGFTNDADWSAVVQTKDRDDLAYIKSILMQGGSGLCWQNAMFDASILEWWYSIPAIERTVFDTMLAAHAANIELPKDLETLSSIWTEPNQPYWKDMVNWNMVKRGKQSIRDVLEYNLIDVEVTHEVRVRQTLEDLSEPKIKAVFDFEMMLLHALWPVSKRGMRVDYEKLRELKSQTTTELAEMRIALRALTGDADFNVKSNKDVGDLIKNLGLPILKMNKTGPATDDKTLAETEIKAKTDLQRNAIRLIRNTRARRDLLSKFIEVEFDEDGRVRGHYNPGGTKTGRLASKKFFPTGRGLQQQNIPKRPTKNEEGEKIDLVRCIFVPDRGKKFCNADLERAESLVVAHLTNDPTMLLHHAPGADAHTLLASLLFEKEQEEIAGDERYIGKQTRHAGNYMEGPRTFMTNVNKYAAKTGVAITFAEAKSFIKRYRELHPFLPQWWNEIEQALWASRTLENLLGRERIFYGHIGSLLPQAVAYKPQSTVGDVLNVGLINLLGGVRREMIQYMTGEDIEGNSQARILSPYIEKLGMVGHYMWLFEELQRAGGIEVLNQVHDSVGFQFESYDVLPIVRELLTIPLTAPKTGDEFKIPVEIAVGPSWGETQVWAEDLEDVA